MVRDGVKEGGPRGFNIFYWGTVPVVRTLHLPTMVRSFLCELETMMVAERDDGVYLRAVPVHSATMLGVIPMTLHLTLGDQNRRAVKTGFSIGETMTVLVDRNGGITPVPRHLALPEDAYERVLDMATPGVEPDRDSLAGPTYVDAVFAMDRGASDDDADLVTEAPRALTLHRILSWVLNFDHAPAAALGSLEALIRNADCYSVTHVSSIPRVVAGIARGLDDASTRARTATA